jgi:hypothetical protein
MEYRVGLLSSFTEQHALRTETTINDTMGFYVRKGAPQPVPPARTRPPSESGVPRSRAGESPVCPHPGRPGMPAASDRRRRPTGLGVAVRRLSGDGALSSPLSLHALTARLPQPPPATRRRSVARPFLSRSPDDLRSSTTPSPGAESSHPEDPRLYRHQLWPHSRLLLREVLSSNPSTERGRASPRRRFNPAPASHALDQLDAEIQKLQATLAV